MNCNFYRLPFYYIGRTIAEEGCDIYIAAIVFAAVHSPTALPKIEDDFSAIRFFQDIAPQKSRFGIKGGRYGFWPLR